MDKLIQKIGLGTVQFGTDYGISNRQGQTKPKEVSEILKIARDNGVEIIDTASAYGNTEKILGRNDLSAFKIVSKFMSPADDPGISQQLLKTLEDLKITSLYAYLAHRPNNLLQNLNQWEELESLKAKGKISKIGFSLNTPGELEQLIEKNITPDLIQVPFNYFDKRFREWMILLKKSGCEIHARSVFLQGLFFVDIEKLDGYFDEVKPVIKKLREQVKNLPSALLNFVLNQSFIDKVIIGVENSIQFKQNLESISSTESLPDLNREIPDSILMPSNWPEHL